MLRTVFPQLCTNQMMVLDQKGDTHVVFQPEIYGPTQNTRAEPAVRADQDKTRHKGFESLEGLLLQGQAGKVGSTGTGRKGGHNRDRKEREEREGQWKV
jgi:hypothetical protein